MNKGFTLIEITIVMAIMGILMSCSLVSLKYYKDMQNKMDVDYNCNAIVSFINNSKMYCKENACSAVITIDKINSLMMLDRGLDMVDKLVLSKNISIYNFIGTQDENQIVINRMGSTGDAGSITLIDNNNKNDKTNKIKIIMGVGTVYVHRE